MADLQFVHRWVPAPDDNAGAAPTLLCLHGTGGTENDLLGIANALCPAANKLAPRGRILERGMPRFFKRFAEGVFDEDDLRLQTHALADFVAQAATEYGFDPDQVFALGFSNGANIAASTLLLRPEALRGAILLRAQVPLHPESKPDLAGKRVFIASGEFDPIVPVDQARELAAMLRSGGALVKHEWQEAGHNLTNLDFQAAQEWVAANIVLSPA